MEMGNLSREDIDDIEESFSRIGFLKFVFAIGCVITVFQLGFYVLNYIGR
jgi:hypothetical protein